VDESSLSGMVVASSPPPPLLDELPPPDDPPELPPPELLFLVPVLFEPKSFEAGEEPHAARTTIELANTILRAAIVLSPHGLDAASLVNERPGYVLPAAYSVRTSHLVSSIAAICHARPRSPALPDAAPAMNGFIDSRRMIRAG
jgi:hypothetical protein